MDIIGNLSVSIELLNEDSSSVQRFIHERADHCVDGKGNITLNLKLTTPDGWYGKFGRLIIMRGDEVVYIIDSIVGSIMEEAEKTWNLKIELHTSEIFRLALVNFHCRYERLYKDYQALAKELKELKGTKQNPVSEQ
jgi:hypothetical protein